MINEYALNPRLLNNWRDFRYFTEKFGVSKGRLISRYPKKYLRALYAELETCRDVERKKIEVHMRSIEQLLLPRLNEWNDRLDWDQNAIAEHAKRPFHAIITSSNPTDHPQILEGESLTENDPLMLSTTSRIVKRDVSEMAESVSVLLTYSRQIVFVDPYFWPNNSRHLRPLAAWLDIISKRPSNVVLSRLEYCSGDRGDLSEYIREAEQSLKRSVPRGMSLSLVRLPKDSMHNRFILTDLGGVMFGIGLDDADNGPLREDVISLLGAIPYNFEWAKYCGQPLCHTVVGTR